MLPTTTGNDRKRRIACGNRPPRVAAPRLPSLPSVPDVVNPDAWLGRVNGQQVVRRVNRQGEVSVDLHPYSISSKLAGQAVTFSSMLKSRVCRWSIPRSIVVRFHSRA